MAKKQNTVPELPSGTTLFDAHCHLDMARGGEVDVLVAEAVQAGVTEMLTIGIDPASSRRALEIANRHDGVYASIGIHPHNVSGITESDYDVLRRLAAEAKVVAYGEIGLDFVKRYCPLAEQIKQYERQIRLAKELRLPLIIHDREAHAEIMKELRLAAPFPAGGVMHCFSGDVRLAREVVDLGFHISIPGIVTYPDAAMLQDVARQVSLSALLIETDSPYLAPVPCRGRENRPSHVIFTALKIAELRGISLADVARATTANSRKLFGIAEKTSEQAVSVP